MAHPAEYPVYPWLERAPEQIVASLTETVSSGFRQILDVGEIRDDDLGMIRFYQLLQHLDNERRSGSKWKIAQERHFRDFLFHPRVLSGIFLRFSEEEIQRIYTECAEIHMLPERDIVADLRAEITRLTVARKMLLYTMSSTPERVRYFLLSEPERSKTLVLFVTYYIERISDWRRRLLFLHEVRDVIGGKEGELLADAVWSVADRTIERLFDAIPEEGLAGVCRGFDMIEEIRGIMPDAEYYALAEWVRWLSGEVRLCGDPLSVLGLLESVHKYIITKPIFEDEHGGDMILGYEQELKGVLWEYVNRMIEQETRVSATVEAVVNRMIGLHRGLVGMEHRSILTREALKDAITSYFSTHRPDYWRLRKSLAYDEDLARHLDELYRSGRWKGAH